MSNRKSGGHLALIGAILAFGFAAAAFGCWWEGCL